MRRPRLPLSPQRLVLKGLVLLALLAGCDRSPEEPHAPADTPSSEPLQQTEPEQEAATARAWQLGGDWLEAAQTECRELHQQLETFLDQPGEATLKNTRGQWHQCHDRWHRLAPLLALSASNPGLFGELERMAFNIDAHPLQPGYLDALPQYPHSGIVNDITLDIKADTLRDQHGLTDSTDVSLGLHAIEFLLWGEVGERPVSDYRRQTRAEGENLDEELTQEKLPRNRRRELILLLSNLLQDDLQSMHRQWTSESGHLQQTYRQLRPASQLQLLKGAARQLLEQQLVTELQTLSDPELAHNRFAGEGLRPILSALQGLQTLMTQGEPPLTQWLGEPEATAQWRKQLETIVADLREAKASDEEFSPDALISQLQLLGTFLQPVNDLEAVTPQS